MKDRGRGVSAQLNSSSNSVTQPVGQQKNVRRTQQIKALHSQFEDLKKKIKDVESKNEKIIENIHKQYDFKKKPQTMQYMVDNEPIVYYEQQQQRRKSQVSGDNQSNVSGDSECEFKMKGPPINRNANNSKKHLKSAFHHSTEFKQINQEPEERDTFNPTTSKVSSHSMRPPLPNNQNSQFGLTMGSQLSMKTMQSQQQFQMNQMNAMNPFQVSMQLPTYPQSVPNMALSQVGSVYGQNYPPVNYQLQQTLRRQRQKIKILQKQLEDRESDTATLKKLQKKYGLLSTSYSEVVEGLLEQFMQQVIKKKIYEIDKYVRKNDNKLKRLQLKIKDKEEEYRSNRIIQEHRSKRSSSRTKRDTSPKQTYYNSVTSAPKIPIRKVNSQLSPPPNIDSASRSKGSDMLKSSQQFTVIANGYEQMIKVKNKDYEALQQKLKQKDKDLTEMTIKCSKLQSKIADYADIPKSSKDRKNSDKQENLLFNLDFDEQKETEIRNLNIKIQQLEAQLKSKLNQLKDKNAALDKINKKTLQLESKNKKIEVELIKLREQNKKSSALARSDNDLQNALKKLQTQLQAKDRECNLLRQKCSKIESEKIQRQCQNFTFSNKIKKVQNLLNVKQEKIQELQKIIQSSAGAEMGDFLQKSMYCQKFDPKQIHQMQADKQKLEEELTHQREEIFALKKNNETYFNRYSELKVTNQNLKREHDTLMIQNESMKINLKAMEFDKYGQSEAKSPLQKLLDEGDCVSQEDDNQIREELEQLKAKFQESQKALKYQKQESLECNTRLIKLSSEMSYYQQLLSQRQGKYEKLRKQFEQNKIQVSQLQTALEQKEEQFEVERKVNNEKIKEIQSQFLEYEQQMRNKQQNILTETQGLGDLRASRFSDQSFITYKNTFNQVNARNEQLQQKLKEQEKALEVQQQMENKIVGEYRQNIDKIKVELREKGKTNEQLSEEVQSLKRKIRIMEQTEIKLKEIAKNENEEEQLLGAPSQRIMELELELAQVKQINSKLTAMEQQLFKQVSDKEQQYQNFVRIIHDKNSKIQELQEILELKEINLSSHIVNSQHKSKFRDSMNSQSSLRYSMLSNNIQMKDKTIDMDLSEAGQSFFENNQSMISNVSEVFGREEFPYQKMHLRRVEQRRLFEKTAAYIKSLKNAIDQKSKRIKLLQKKIDSLRNSQLVRKDIYDIKDSFQGNREEVFKDYLSVQLDNTNSQRYRYKQLEHQTKLTIEENNILNNQIQAMQNELQKSEQQQAGLMKVKDLYKDEIKALNKKLQDQAKVYEDEVKKERQKVQQSQSVQKMQAIKQLYLKIMEIIVALQIEGPKSNKREERRRLLQDYVKVFCNLLDLQSSVRDKLLTDLIK